ncbi:MAG: hypothetical protein B7Z73_16860 [Planctomycetia bacterium 21-64-5]|nr:MAG: hypothetical protein B7Z73_16860 [Planctomycetia bacterium 21-64-5]
MPDTKQIVFGQQGGLIEILYAATGFLVRRQVYLDIQHQLGLPWCNQRFGGQPIVPYFLPLVKGDGLGQWYMSEDYSFCERARQCGYRVWADTTVRLGHLGQCEYHWENAGSSPPRYDSYYFDLQ